MYINYVARLAITVCIALYDFLSGFHTILIDILAEQF